MPQIRTVYTTLVLLFSAAASVYAQGWDHPSGFVDSIFAETHNKLKVSLESRARYEIRTGNGFGRDPDIETGLVRTRVGASFVPVKWLKFSGMVQDSRAPWYGPNAPNTVRDHADLHEAYLELFPEYKTGFGLTAGRMMLNYGEGRLIGTPQWGNVARTYDHVRLYQRWARAQIEFLVVSPIKVRPTEFNRPVLGDRVWGVYNVFPNIYRKQQLDVYVLRHDQNRPGGFAGGSALTGTDKLAVNTFGLRTTGPMPAGAKYSIEAAFQTGSVGPASHRAGAWFSSLSRRSKTGGRNLDVSAEYKYASGTANPGDPAHSGTFDQLYPANHDKFGHEDLFGWRNIHNLRAVVSYAVTKALAVNLMYDNSWLASERDALYNGAGRAIARSAQGNGGRHVGQEADVYVTYKYKHFTLGGGYGRLFAGDFLLRTTPGVGPTYVYVFHTYSL